MMRSRMQEILDHEGGLLESTAVRHVLAVGFVSGRGEYPLHGGEYVLVCSCCGAGVNSGRF